MFVPVHKDKTNQPTKASRLLLKRESIFYKDVLMTQMYKK